MNNSNDHDLVLGIAIGVLLTVLVGSVFIAVWWPR